VTALAGWPYAQRSAQINGHTMAYVDEAPDRRCYWSTSADRPAVRAG